MSVEKMMPVTPITGRSSPLGTTTADGGINFSLFSRNASGVELLFFDREDDAGPARVIRLDSHKNHTYHYWHVFVLECDRGRSTATASRGRRRRNVDFASTPPRYCSTPMAGAWSYRRPMTVRSEAAGRHVCNGDEERGRRSKRVRLAGR